MKVLVRKLLRENLIREIIWYHGTNKEFDNFDLKYFGETDSGWWGYGIYFHSEKDRGGYGDIVKSVKLNFKKPIILPTKYSGRYLYDIVGIKANLPSEYKDDSSMNIIKRIGNKEFTNLCLSLGYDGMIITYAQGTKEAVVFDDSIIEIINQNINI